MKKYDLPKFKYVFLTLDLLCFSISFFYALTEVIPDFWYLSSRNYLFCGSHLCLFLIFLFVHVFSFRYNNLYKRNVVISHLRQFILIVKSLLAGIIVCVLILVISNITYLSDYGKNLVSYFFFCNLLLFTIYRACLGKGILKFLIKNKIYRRFVLIVGSDKAGKHVVKSLENDVLSDFHIVGLIDDYKDIGTVVNARFKTLGKLSDLKKISDSMPIDEIIIAIDHAPYDRLIYVVEKCIQTGKYVRIYSDLLNVVAKKMDVELYSNIPVIEFPSYNLSTRVVKDKRSVDVMLAIFSLFIFAPLFLVIAIGIKLSSKGPVIFKQKRIGKNGQPFTFYKFRSMYTEMPDTGHREFVRNFINGNNKKNDHHDSKEINVFKIADDPRIFKFGKFLRKTSLDEFPQFINVLKGDMSFVGPRPCLPYEWDQYEDWHKERLNILPGCTGLWQALGRNSVTFEEMVILDLFYNSNLSLWLDFKIILKTFPVIFLGKGGY